MSCLFTPEELAHFARDLAVTSDSAAVAERVVWGWLKPRLGLTERPTEVPPEVFSWAVELGAIAHENPTGLTSYQLGAEQFSYSAERRQEILDEAERWAAVAMDTPVASPLSPVGSFPEPLDWPDPASPAAYSWT